VIATRVAHEAQAIHMRWHSLSTSLDTRHYSRIVNRTTNNDLPDQELKFNKPRSLLELLQLLWYSLISSRSNLEESEKWISGVRAWPPPLLSTLHKNIQQVWAFYIRDPIPKTVYIGSSYSFSRITICLCLTIPQLARHWTY